MLTDVLTVWKSFVHVYMRTMTMKRLILFLSLLSAVFGHHILCIQNVPSRSHHTLMMGIVKPLLEAGHQWSGEDEVRKRMSGRMMVVRLLCRDISAAASSPLDLRGVFTPCVAFRVQGTPPRHSNSEL
ncbi:hypothetical protein KGM_211509 [Danaus plexippus plexippus]|uniref:Uncharacterized protein n=1 Tax=Danaus plexippus plexippus TaxID=278856 RepID=A0A212FDC9_DANPL|nr:hypothetical protein KGM_211509 [Danaus plexippus plexippus]